MARLLAVLAAGALAGALLIASTGAARASHPGDPWGELYRAFHGPTLAPGESCPVSSVAPFKFVAYGAGPGIGPGPAYPIGFEQPGSVVRFRYPLPDGSLLGSVWSAVKVLWFVAPTYRGRILIRGQRLDAPDVLRFSEGVEPPTELRISAGQTRARIRGIKLKGQRYWPSGTRLRASGCYAYQVDGTSFSRVVVFRAVAQPTG